MRDAALFRDSAPLPRSLLSVLIFGVALLAASADPADQPKVVLGLGHTARVRSVAISPDGTQALSGSYDDTLRLWDLATGKELRVLVGHKNRVTAVALSSDGKYAVSGGDDRTVKLWDLATGKELRTFSGHTDGITSVAISPDGRYLLSGSSDKTAAIWDGGSGQRLFVLSGHGDVVTCVGFTRDGKYAVSGSKDRTLKVWDIGSGKLLRSFTGHKDPVNCMAISPDGQSVLSGDDSGVLKLWRISNCRTAKSFDFRPNGADLFANIDGVALSPDGNFALVGITYSHWNDATHTVNGEQYHFDDWSYSLLLWDLRTGKELWHQGRVSGLAPNSDLEFDALALSPDGNYALAGAALDWGRGVSFMCLFDRDGKLVRTLSDVPAPVTSVGFSPDGKIGFVWIGKNDFAYLWDLQSGVVVGTFPQKAPQQLETTMSPDGKLALSATGHGSVRYWTVSGGKTIAQLTLFPDGEWVCLTPDGHYVASAHGATYLRVQVGGELQSIDDYVATYSRPDLVQQALAASGAPASSSPAAGSAAARGLGIDARNLTAEECRKAGLTEGSGIYVMGVDAGSMALELGIKVGDYILALNGQPTAGIATVKQLLASGAAIQEVKVWRNGSVLTLAGSTKL